MYNIAETMRQALNTAGREVDTLLGQHWTGDAANEFSDGWDETHSNGTQLMQHLISLAEKLGVTADSYRATDTGNATRISSLDLP